MKLRPVRGAAVAAFHKIVRRGDPVLDRIVAGTTATSASLLWFGTAACLAAVGGRFGRRAALRGLLSVALSSALTNGLLKVVVRRPRPSKLIALRARPLGGRPKSSAFPSGHTASAAAFAVGAAQELPGLSVPLGVLATAVGWSRVRTRANFPTDVFAGAAVGGAVALATRRFWPVAPRTPAEIRPALTSVGADPSPEGRGLSIVVNPSAGSALSKSPADELRRCLPEAEVLEVGEGMEFSDALEKASQSAACALGVSGGDGSVNAAAAVSDAHDKPLMVIPGGTLNHFAHDLGLEDVSDAIVAVTEGEAVAVDLATIADEPFLNTASFGAYADLVDARERLEGKFGKWPAAFFGLVHVLRGGEPIDVELDGRRRKLWMIFIGNCCYHPEGFAPSWRERLDDGQLDIRVVDGTQPYARLRLLLAVLTGRLGRSRVYESWTAKELRVRSHEGPLRLARDGETFDGPEEFIVCKRDRPLRVYVPKREP
ncbi:MAG: bifunctional phosphatase PAP2/diacylglycerol kinase family protein [Solirubrobacterales bacterium]